MQVPDTAAPVLPQIESTYMVMAQAQQALQPQAGKSSTEPYTISRGPEFNKWDEALINHGVIRIPKDLDEPQKWMNQKHIQDLFKSNEIDREDRPDGSVILRWLKAPIS